MGNNRPYILSKVHHHVSGLAIFITVLSISLVGDGLNDAKSKLGSVESPHASTLTFGKSSRCNFEVQEGVAPVIDDVCLNLMQEKH